MISYGLTEANTEAGPGRKKHAGGEGFEKTEIHKSDVAVGRGSCGSLRHNADRLFRAEALQRGGMACARRDDTRDGPYGAAP